MEQVLFFLVMLVGVTHAAETKCNSTQNATLCSVTLGGSVYIQVIHTNASGHHVWCKKQHPSGLMNVFTLKNEKVTIYEAFRNRTEFFINNATFKMTNMEKNDSGQYIIEAFDPKGVFVRKMNVQLDVQLKGHASSFHISISAGGAVVLVLILVFCVSCCVYKCKKKSVPRI